MDRGGVVTALTLARFPFVGLGYWGALNQDALATITFGLTAVATDVADGIFARRWHVETEWGSQLDSFADFVFYTSFLVWVYLFVPDQLQRHMGLIATFFALYLVMLLGGYLFKQTIAVHDRISRTTGTVGVLVGVFYIAVGYREWMLFGLSLLGTVDIAHRLHSIVQAVSLRRRGERERGEEREGGPPGTRGPKGDVGEREGRAAPGEEPVDGAPEG